jgi:hypothetical protein
MDPFVPRTGKNGKKNTHRDMTRRFFHLSQQAPSSLPNTPHHTDGFFSPPAPFSYQSDDE